MNKIRMTLNKNKRIKLLLILVIILLLMIITFVPNGPFNTIRNAIQKEDEYSISYEVKGYDETTGIYDILLTITNPEGIEEIENIDLKQTIKCYSKKKIGIDYQVPDQTEYNFNIKLSNGQTKKEKVILGRQREGIGTYIKKQASDVYVNAPNLDGYVKEFTRYIKYDDVSGALQPGNWITDEEPVNWYNYKEQKWANIYVEEEGVENYYVWIPRYCYKIPTDNTAGNERTDIKFIDSYNNYKDPDTDEEIKWETLKAQGYKVPEAFEYGTYNEISLSGYWIGKYELSELENFVIDYNLTASSKAFNVINLKKNTEKEIAKYTYAINGKIDNELTNIGDYSLVNGSPNQTNIINVTALDSDGRIIGSMTKKMELADANAPDLTGFDKDTTFYVYWDDDGNEHNEIPISQKAPEEWYNYTYSEWANIVTRNDGLENYYVWIPRYQYSLNQTNQRTSIKFKKSIETDTEAGYKIPEAFTWTDGNKTKELEGYWISKYEISSEEAEARISAELSPSSNLIRVKDIKGTLITEAQTNNIDLNIEYYLNENKVYEGTDVKENYVYEGLKQNTIYTINIIVREQDSNKFVGAITRKVTTKEANAPDFTGFNTDMTYYVLYDNDGNMTIGDKIKTNGSNIPDNWYDYSNSKWANIAVTDGNIENGQIVNATTTNYLVWIPRYEYRILTDRDNESKTNKRVEINFLEGLSTDTSPGYQIPEAFTWTMGEESKELYGYWISKYEISQ